MPHKVRASVVAHLFYCRIADHGQIAYLCTVTMCQHRHLSHKKTKYHMNDKVIKSRRYHAVLLALLCGMVVMFFARDRKRFYAASGVVWTTEYHITYEGKHDLNDSIQQIFNRIDRSASVFNKSSRLSAINANATDSADSHIALLYATARRVYEKSGHLYDPTVMPLVNAWGFGHKNGRLPTDVQIDSMLAFVGMDKTSLERGRIVKSDKRTQFDFSSIAKGYACDEIGRMLTRNGVNNYMVEIGGEIAARGVNSRGERWKVSVDMPIDQDSIVSHESALVITIDSGGVATSGNYRKFKMVDGHKVAHILNPTTGHSESSDLLSATIVADDCATADAWATACMVMGTKRVKAAMERNNSLGVMIVSADAEGRMTVWSNKRFADMVTTVP